MLSDFMIKHSTRSIFDDKIGKLFGHWLTVFVMLVTMAIVYSGRCIFLLFTYVVCYSIIFIFVH